MICQKKTAQYTRTALAVFGCIISLIGALRYEGLFLVSFDKVFIDYRIKELSRLAPVSGKSSAVVFDTETIYNTGFPLERNLYSEVLNSRNEESVFLIDVLFSETKNAAKDTILAQALSEHSVILPIISAQKTASKKLENVIRRGLFASFGVKDIETFSFEGPNDFFLNEKLALGVSEVLPDDDGNLRWFPLVYKSGGAYLPTLPMAAYLAYTKTQMFVTADLDSKIKNLVLKNGNKIIQTVDLSLDPLGKGRLLLFPKKKLEDSWLNFINLSEQGWNIATSERSIVLVGITAAGVAQNHPNVVSPYASALWNLHSVVDALLLKNEFKRSRSTLVLEVLCLLFICLIAVLSGANWNFRTALGGQIFLALGLLSLNAWSFERHEVLLIGPGILYISFNILSLVTHQYSKSERQKKMLKKNFNAFVDPHIVQQLVNNESEVALAGEEKEVVVMFMDLRGFTSLSEKVTAHVLVELLNEYFQLATELIKQNGGTVDKFIGDAVMAFWGAPGVPLDDISASALKFSGEMIDRFSVLAESWQKRYSLSGKADVGIGLHRGKAIVGNIGGHLRFNYTAIGDVVNIASRLEGLTKYYGVHIVYSEDVSNQGFQLDQIFLKGKDKGIKIWTQIELSHEIRENYQKAKEQYCTGKFNLALVSFKKLAEYQPISVAANLFIERIEYLKANPQSNWTGVWKMKEK